MQSIQLFFLHTRNVFKQDFFVTGKFKSYFIPVQDIRQYLNIKLVYQEINANKT